MLRHLPFFDALAGLQEGSDEWRCTSAGLGVLRLVDERAARRAARRGGSEWSAHVARHAVESVPEWMPVRTVLAGILELAAADRPLDVELLAPRLLAYGHTLDLDGSYALASDVFESLLRVVGPRALPDVRFDAQMRLGYCHRLLGRLDDAALAAAAAREVAAELADPDKLLRVRVSDAKLALARGDLPQAARLLDETAAAAAAAALSEVRAIALHDRAAVAFAAGEHEAAVHFAYAALEGTTSVLGRDRVLSDLAAMFVQLGVRAAARDALLLLVATAREQYTRWLATINLLEVAALDGAELVFEQYRRDLAWAALPVDLRVSYQLAVGEGYRRFGRVEPARAALQAARAMAERHRLPRDLVEAEEALTALERGEGVEAAVEAEAPATLLSVTQAIREMRTLAEAG